MKDVLLPPGTKRRWSRAAETAAATVIETADFKDLAVPIVYALTDLASDEICYVGCCSIGVGYRLTRHFYFASSGKSWAISKWLRDVNYQVGLVILAIDPEDPNAVEFEWIHNLLAAGCALTNYAGGETTDVQKQAASEANRRRWSDPAERQLLAERNKQGVTGFRGRAHSAESREKIGAASRGIAKGSPSAETRRKMSEAAQRRCARAKEVMPS